MKGHVGRSARKRARVGASRSASTRSAASRNALGGRQTPPHLIIPPGRRRELASVERGIVGARDGHGGVVLIVGERGIGKTWLAEAIEARARELGLAVSWGRGWEGAPPAFWPWPEVVRDCLSQIRGRLAPAARRAEALLADRSTHRAAPENLADEVAVAQAILALIQQVTRRQPLVLLLDDLHFATPEGLRVLRFVAERIGTAPCLVVATCRADQRWRRADLTGALSRLPQGTRHLNLAPLSADDVALILASAMGSPPSEDLVAAIHGKSGGNPFFVVKMADAIRLHATSPSSSALSPVPPGVREEVIGYRLAGLTPPCRTMLSTASVLGLTFRLVEIEATAQRAADGGPDSARAIGPSDTDRESTMLHSALEEALRSDLLRRNGDDDAFAFVHPIVRDALYEELGPRERMRLHAAAGEALEILRAADLAPAYHDIAEHFLRAGVFADRTRAVGYADLAARQMLSDDQALRAEGLLERALGLLGEPSEARVEETDLRCRLWLSLSQAKRRSGDRDGARRTAAHAAELAKSLAPQGAERSAALLARAALAYGADPAWSEAGVIDERFIALAQDALAALSPQPSALRVRLLGRIGEELWYPDFDSGRWRDQLLAEVVTVARSSGEPEALIEALLSRHKAVWFTDTVEERLGLCAEVTALARQERRRDLEARGQLFRALDLFEAGAIVDMRRHLRLCTDAARDISAHAIVWHAEVQQATLAAFEGRLDDAERLMSAAHAHGERLRLIDADMFLAVHFYALRRLQGRFDELVPVARAFADQHPMLPVWRVGVADSLAQSGQLDEARREFEVLAAGDFAEPPRDWNWLLAMALLAEVCCVIEDRPRAALLYERLLPFANRNVTAVPGLAGIGVASRQLGQLAALLGRDREAAAHFEHAIARNAEMGALPYLAHTQCQYAAMLARGRGRTTADTRARRASAHADDLAAHATGLIDLAETAYARLGMNWWANQAGALRATLNLPTRRARSPGRPLVSGRASCPAIADEGLNVFRRDGKRWIVVWRGRRREFRNYIGARYLSVLLRHPGQTIAPAALDAMVRGDPRRSAPGQRRSTAAVRADRLGLRSHLAVAPAIPDRRARDEYVLRLRDIEHELSEAEADADIGRSERLSAEREALMAEVLASHRSTDGSEAVRKRVWKNIWRGFVPHLRRELPAFVAHLESCLITRNQCRYDPPPGVDWQF